MLVVRVFAIQSLIRVNIGMDNNSITLGEIVLTIDDINVIINGDINCRFHVSHRMEPEETLAELYGEVKDRGELEVLCKTKLTVRRIEILTHFLHMYEKNIIRFFEECTMGKTPYMFRDEP
jgi:hypothetical protein